jgi:hypothetical protein
MDNCGHFGVTPSLNSNWPPHLSEHDMMSLKKKFLHVTSPQMIESTICQSCNQVYMRQEMETTTECKNCPKLVKWKTDFPHSANPVGIELPDIPECLTGLTYPEKLCISLYVFEN